MIPYANFLYFGVSLYALLPDLAFTWFRRLSKYWLVLATLLMLSIQYGLPRRILFDRSLPEIWLVAGFGLGQYCLALGFLRLQRLKPGRVVFYLALLLSLAPLLAARFFPFILPSYNLAFLGLSYVTFRALDVLISIQDRAVQSLPPLQYLTFLLFFPAVSSGPIDRYARFGEDWQRPQRTRQDVLSDLDGGVHRIFIGFLYKFILAALIKRYWLDPAALGAGFPQLLSYMYAYTFYLFFDFAGYSAFAVGFSYLFGIHTPENFNLPFLARNIRDFWNRWHISLSAWFRDHVYSRFVFAAIQGGWFKNRYTASYLGFLISMGLMGLWHGTAWHYLVYGLYHALLLIANDAWGRWSKKNVPWRNSPAWRAASIFITFQAVCFGMLIFSGRLG